LLLRFSTTARRRDAAARLTGLATTAKRELSRPDALTLECHSNVPQYAAEARGMPVAFSARNPTLVIAVAVEDWRCVLAQARLETLLRRVQGEFLEMPGLRLTTAQAQRLLGLTRSECESLMHTLLDSHFLRRTSDGSFVLFDANSPGTSERPQQRLTGRVPATIVPA
jgi:hypothetical protein